MVGSRTSISIGLMMVLGAMHPAAAIASTAGQIATSSVVIISTQEDQGSGFFVRSNEVLTANHVVASSRTVLVQFGGERSTATVIKRDPLRDLALLRTNLPGIPVSIGKADLGATIYAIGAPEGYLSISSGIVSAFTLVNGAEGIQTDAPINPGNSGGPLVDAEGKVVGIVEQKISSQEGVGFAVGVGAIQIFLSTTSAQPKLRGKFVGQLSNSQGGHTGMFAGITFGAIGTLFVTTLIFYLRRVRLSRNLIKNRITRDKLIITSKEI